MKDSVNEVCISILNCHPQNEFNIEGFRFVFKPFCYIFTNFPKKISGGRGNRKEPSFFLLRKQTLSSQ